MPETKYVARSTQYASSGDFCRIFHEEMNSLYMLSLLLTADPEKAEQCFVSGLEDAVQGNPVFKEWARSWARRVIILNGVRVIKPRPADGSGGSSSDLIKASDKSRLLEPIEIAGLLALEAFDRFVYVMTVLEGYSDHECSVLLSCARRDVLAARTRALQQAGSAIEMHYRQLLDASSEVPAGHESGDRLLHSLADARLATSA
jgi:hypothetical protein